MLESSSAREFPSRSPNSSLCSSNLHLRIIECSVALVVSSVPAMSSFWRRKVAQSRIFSRVSSLFSSRGLSSKGTSSAKKSSQESSGYTGSVDPYNTDPYNIDPYAAEINGYHELDRQMARFTDPNSSIDLPKKAHCHETIQPQSN